jgi:hypothetical protein
MAQRLFTGQYGPLSQVDTRPIVQAGQAWGQAIQGTLENVGKAIEKHQLNKQWEAAEPKLQAYADSLNLPPDQRDIILNSIKRDKDAMANGYTAITKAADLAMQQKGVQLAQQQIRQTMEAKKTAEATQKLSDSIQAASYYRSQGKPLPETIAQNLYMYGNNLGVPEASIEARIEQLQQSLKQAQEVQDLKKRDTESLIESRAAGTEATEAGTTINKAKQLLYTLPPKELMSPFATRTPEGYTQQQVSMAKGMYQREMVKALKDNPSPAVGKQITDIDTQRDKLLKTSYTIDKKGKRATLEEILADPKLMNKRVQNDNLNRDLMAYDALSSQISNIAGTTPETRTFTDPQTGQVRTATKTVSEWMQIDAEKRRRQAEEQQRKVQERRAIGRPLIPDIPADSSVAPFITPEGMTLGS